MNEKDLPEVKEVPMSMDEVLALASGALPKGCRLEGHYLEAYYTVVCPFKDPDGVVRRSVVIFKPEKKAEIVDQRF